MFHKLIIKESVIAMLRYDNISLLQKCNTFIFNTFVLFNLFIYYIVLHFQCLSDLPISFTHYTLFVPINSDFIIQLLSIELHNVLHPRELLGEVGVHVSTNLSLSCKRLNVNSAIYSELH